MNDYLKNNDYFKAIISYLSNKLSNKERNEVESICQADAFEQEAMDGFANLTPNEIVSDIEGLNVIKGKNKFKHWNLVLIIAAAIILLSGSLFYILKRDKPNQTQEPEIETIEFINDTQTFQTDTTLNADTIEEQVVEEKINIEKEEKTEELVPEKTEKKQIKEETTTLERKAPIEEKSKEIIEEKQIESKEPSVIKQDSIAKESNQNSSNEELTQVPEEEVEMEESDLSNDTIEINDINHFGQNTEPSPQGGMELYKIYLSENKIKPSTSDSVENRAVNLQFTIDEFGNPKDIVIIESPDSLFSKEAIRLVEEGPRWTPNIEDGTPVEGSANLTINFQQ